MKKLLIFSVGGVLILVVFFSSCKKFLEINPPKTSLVQKTVFQNNDQAISAVTGIYSNLGNSSVYASGDQYSITCLAGLSSDELIGYTIANVPFYENQVTPESAYLQMLYSGPYQSIYTANAVLEGLEESSGVTPPVKEQLKGEALFIRSFAYFYLVNMFGPVPLQLSTDYRLTQYAPKTPTEQIYQQIVNDLKIAETLLTDVYPSSGRARPNKSVVQAMLARVYLYLKNWENAEKYSSLIIAKTGTYNLVNLDAVFLANSAETIWQLMPSPNTNAREGGLFILTTTPANVSLRASFALNAFEPNDKRQTSWVKSFTNNTGTYYYPFKYKVQSSTTPTEYSMILRLAELYLIRAEARINQEGKTGLGIEDLNIIRQRARPVPTPSVPNPLPPLSLSLNKIDALSAVEQERKVELFSEWGHRWFDLKRTGRVNNVLSQIKSNWKDTDVFYPIPQDELDRNKNVSQNEGY